MSTFDTPEPIEARLDLAVGFFAIRATDGAATTVDVQPTDPTNDEDVQVADETLVEFDDGVLVVRGPRRGGMGVVRSWLSRGWGGSVDVTVEVPTGSAVELSLGSGDLHTEGRLGDCRIRTGLGSIRIDAVDALDCKSGSGDLTIDRILGRADLTTASGQVRLGHVAGDAIVRNSNGATRVASADAHLRIKAANGDIEVGRAGSDVVAKSANGSIEVEDVERGTVVLETHVGDVEIGIRRGTAAWLDLDATAGTVRNELDATGDPGAPDHKVEVRARTTIGAIIVRRSRGTDHA